MLHQGSLLDAIGRHRCAKPLPGGVNATFIQIEAIGNHATFVLQKGGQECRQSVFVAQLRNLIQQEVLIA